MKCLIVEGLLPLATPITEYRIDPENANKHSQENIDAIKASLEEFGQRTPLVVNRNTGIIEKGNGTWVAARALGWDHLAVIFTEDDASTARDYAIADNRSSELSRFDPERLKEHLAKMRPELKKRLWPAEKMSQILEAARERAESMPPVIPPAAEDLGGEELDDEDPFGEADDDDEIPLEYEDEGPIDYSESFRESRTYHFKFDVSFEDATLIERALKEWLGSGQPRDAFLVQLAEVYLNGI